MALTPVEIRHIRLGRGLRGYKRASVDALLADVAQSFEDVWRERADLADKVEQLEVYLARHNELESLLRTTLVSAESAAQQLREQARKEAETIVGEAHAEARATTILGRWFRTRPDCASALRPALRRPPSSDGTAIPGRCALRRRRSAARRTRRFSPCLPTRLPSRGPASPSFRAVAPGTRSSS